VRQIVRGDLRCGRRVVRRWGGGSIASVSGRRSLAASRARRRPPRLGCRWRSVSGGSARVAGCDRSVCGRRRAATCRSVSGKRSRCFARAARACGRSRAGSAFAVDDLARAASERGDPQRPARVPGDGGAVARRSARASTEGGQARHERGAAAVRAGAARWKGRDAGRRQRRWTGGALDRPASRSSEGSSLGEVVEPGADRAPASARLPG